MSIYLDDIELCNEYAGSARGFHRVCLFVLATIQQQLETVPLILETFTESGAESKWAFGSKKRGIRWLADNHKALQEDVSAAISRGSDRDAMEYLLECPGIGLVKAGFILQLCHNRVGCLDVHNIKLYEIPLRAVRYPKLAQWKTRIRYIDRYIALCASLGGSAQLWSAWCDHVARTRPANWDDGADVSYFHYAVVSGSYDTRRDDLFTDIDYEPKYLRSEVTPC